jgi:hypothetical protein
MLKIFGATIMHIRPNQTHPSVQLDAMYAAEKSAAKAEAAQTRKKLMELASELSAEAGEAYVVQVESREEPREREKKQYGHNRRYKPEAEPEAEEDTTEDDHSVSDWA